MKLLTADRWLTATLRADATLQALQGQRVYVDDVPVGATAVYPMTILAQVNPRPDLTTMTAELIALSEVWQAAMICEGDSYAAVEGIAERVLALLHRVQGSVTGGVVVSCVLVGGPYKIALREDDGPYCQIVLEFEIVTQ